MASITSSGSKKGAVSINTQYNDAIAAQKKAAALQKNIESVANLSAANASLTASKKKLDNRKDLLTIIQYAQSLYLAGKWGTDAFKNSAVYYGASCTASTYPAGATITSGDLVKINNYISAEQLIVDGLDKKIAAIDAQISANNKKITSIDIGGKLSAGGNNGNSSSSKVTDNNAQTADYKGPPEFPTSDYTWNLPPHDWSLPMDPATVNPGFVGAPSSSLHANRRGRIWYYNGYVGPTNVLKADTGTYDSTLASSNTPPPGSVNKYGFQFIWNPETFNQTTSVNMTVTPSNTDPTIALTGFAAANSTMSFTLRLDRTNDFASAKSSLEYADSVEATNVAEVNTSLNALSAIANANLPKGAKKVATIGSGTSTISLANLAKYYNVGKPGTNGTVTDLDEKINQLLKYGTEADLEYLYRVVNGDGWKGIGGRETSNMGYLMPALIRVDLGNQKFVGVVSSIQVNHIAFTRDMIPIRSDVSVSIDLRANIQPTTNTSSAKKKS